jgi:plasmid rolling circle replication initiator protein Rep
MLNQNSAADADISQVTAGHKAPRYLTDYSPGDKPWDVHRAQAQAVEEIYAGTVFNRLAGRIRDCTGYLGFAWEADPDTGENRLKLRSAHFCRVRHCPVCQWRRSLMWQARFLKALPGIEAAHPKVRWLFLTLTVRNVPITELRSQIRSMNEAWHRLVKRHEFASNVLGWIRTTEVTRGRDGSAHPHFHCLLMVRPSYFGKGYVKQERWVDLWRECARLDYRPSVRIQVVKPKSGTKPGSTESPLRWAVAETLKYSVKPEDMMNRDWLLELTKQVHRLRFIASGGALKDVLRETEETERDLMLADEDGEGEGDPVIWFDWHRGIKRYVLGIERHIRKKDFFPWIPPPKARAFFP